MAGWHHNNAKWQAKMCAVCRAVFTPRSGFHKFCSNQCKGKWKYITGEQSTENQYLKISGDWGRYYARLLQAGKRKADGLTRDHLMALHEAQGGRCALSGLEMTCKLNKGTITYTNASIDRIEAGGAYSPGNVRLVCRHVNSWRGVMPTEDFINVCRAVVAMNGGM
jgi:hypothetical protein